MFMDRAAWVVALCGVAVVDAACQTNLQIDNFAFFANGTNSMGSQASGKSANIQ
jgi:hypothetical protein